MLGLLNKLLERGGHVAFPHSTGLLKRPLWPRGGQELEAGVITAVPGEVLQGTPSVARGIAVECRPLATAGWALCSRL
jgi:hypothetical protein